MQQNLNDLLTHEVQDLYSAESQLLELLPKLKENTGHPKLAQAFDSQMEHAQEHQDRIYRVGKILSIDPDGEKCQAMEGLVNESEHRLAMEADEDVMDAALIGATQRISHYLIAGYGTALHYARMLGEHDAAHLLAKTLDEEKDINENLNDIAIEKINKEAM